MVNPRVKAGGWRRHIEGWQAGLIALAVAGLGLLLGAPRAVEPHEVPLPVADAAALRRSLEADQTRARQMAQASESEKSGVGYDLRVIGEHLRAYNEADEKQDREALALARGDALRAAFIVRERDGVEPLLRLRAYHLTVFLRELQAWESSGEVSDELRSVGGDFVGLAERAGWVRGPHRLLADTAARASLFKRRFNEVLSLRDAVFALSIDEARALYAFLLSHPVRPEGPPEASEQASWAWTLRKVEEIALVDPDYPADLARGVAYYRLGDGRAAVLSLREHLAKHQDGPYTLRARNYLLASLKLAGSP